MKIAAGICEYADPEGLYRCLASLGLDNGGIDLAIIIHGRFNHFDIPNIVKEEALADTKRIISKFPPNTVELAMASTTGASEIDNRNLYLKIAAKKGYDWLLVIDTDEYIARNADWKTFRSQLEFVMSLGLEHQIFDVQFEGNIPAYIGPRPRLFYRPKSIKYWKRHYWWVLEESMTLYKGLSDAGRIIGGIYMMHDHTIRDSKYYNAAINYKEWQQVEEAKVAEQQQEIKSSN